ncbi:MAG: hypothetical protein WCO19_03120 [Candidatus Saccharibacteria bacterium]
MPTANTDYITKEVLSKELRASENRIIDELSSVIGIFAQQMNDEISNVKIDIADIRASIDRLTNTVDGFVKRLEDMEIVNTSRDSQYQRLLAWAERVSTKTGIPLEY